MIICMGGYRGSGKDTCANYLIKQHNFSRVALADPLKDMVAEEYGIDRKSLDDPKLKESPITTMPVDPKDGFTKMVCEFMVKEFAFITGEKAAGFGYKDGKLHGRHSNDGSFELYHTPRSLAILKGSTNRVVNPNYWVEKTFNKIEDLSLINKSAVVTDLRYKSEMAQFKEKFGEEVVFIRVNRGGSTSVDPSERDLDNTEFDFYIDNSSTLENAIPVHFPQNFV